MWYSFLIKLIFTTVTLGAGFKGGEVTPLFFIGAALGNVCGLVMGQDTQLFSALGLVSVFGAAANTPIACTFMGIELFGGAKTLPFLLSCYIAYLVSNTKDVKGIYKQEPPRGDANEVAPIPRMSSGTLRGSSGTLRGFPRV
jgi:H+/Cl- antiporter ClcA